jgi:ent-kaurene synthase
MQRERRQGKLNSVLLLVHHSGGSMSIEAAQDAIQKRIDSSMRDLLRMVLREDGVVPRPCKEIFWALCKSTHLFYSRTDGFTSPTEMDGTLDAIIKEPLKLQVSNPSPGCSVS